MAPASSISLVSSTIYCLLSQGTEAAFGTVIPNRPSVLLPTTTSSSSSTTLHAIGVLARKAKEADLRQYVQNDITEDVLSKVKEMKANLEQSPSPPDQLQKSLTKRKGTISIITEFKRKLSVGKSGYMSDDIFSPEGMSPIFREFGASAVALMADERMGGCTYTDLEDIVKEQQTAQGFVPGPLPVINSDLVIDEVQIARAAVVGASAIVVTYGVVDGGKEKVEFLIKCAAAVGLEVVVQVMDHAEAQDAVDAGARILYVVDKGSGEVSKSNEDEEDEQKDSAASEKIVEQKLAVVTDLNVPEGEQICTIANILALNNKQLQEVEEAWRCRDKGFNAVWISDALYKSGNDPMEHAGAIIKSMSAKSSVRWASAKAKSGKGEGAKEYLGDILM